MGLEALIPIATSAIGAIGGSQGQRGSSTTRQEMDPRMVPYIFGNGGQGGLLGMTQTQLQNSQSPERQALLNMQRMQGAGLLGGAVAGNPWFAGYQGGQLGGHMDPGMIKNGLSNSYGNFRPGVLPQLPTMPAPSAQPTQQPGAQPPPVNQPFSMEDLMRQIQEAGAFSSQQGGGF